MSMDLLTPYLTQCQESGNSPEPGMLSYLANLQLVAQGSPNIAKSTVAELSDQSRKLKLIASENYCSLSTQAAMGNLLTDKYCEGIPGARYYAGCENVDEIETYAADKAKKLFGADHAYVQPHSGIDANMVAFLAVLNARVEEPKLKELGAVTAKGNISMKKASEMSTEDWNKLRHAWGNQKLLGLSLASGGHLTHGYRPNVSGKLFESHAYHVDRESNLLDYDAIREQAKEVKPLILLAGYSAYPRRINFKKMREIADEVGAVLMVDMAHFAGLVAGGVFGQPGDDTHPLPHAQIVTSTTHKTLRGPRGGIVLCAEEFAKYVDKGCPLVLGGPLPHVMAAKAVAFDEALKPEFKTYARQIVDNAQALAKELGDMGCGVITGGTDNHIVVADVTPYGVSGVQAEQALRQAGITLNRNAIPFDTKSPLVCSGLRIGTAAVTTRGMGTAEMHRLAELIIEVLKATEPKDGSEKEYELSEAVAGKVRGEVEQLLESFPLYPELDIPMLEKAFDLTPQTAAV